MVRKKFDVQVYIYFIIGALLVIFLFPGEKIFTSPVRENKKQGAEEKSVQSIKPVFHLEENTATIQINRFKLSDKIHKTEITEQLKNVYHRGIINISDYIGLQENNVDSIFIVQGNEREIHSVSNIYTPKSAYIRIKETLLNDTCPISTYEEFNALNLNEFLCENLIREDGKTKKSQQNGLQKIVQRIDIHEQYGYISGVVILISGLFTCFFFYFYYMRERMYAGKKDVFFSLMIAVLFIVLTELFFGLHLFSIYIIPYAIIPIVVRIFLDSRTAQATHLFTVSICSLMSSQPFDFILMQLIVCMVSIYVLKDLTQRSELIKCSFYILGAYILTYAGLLLFRDGDFSNLRLIMLLYFVVNFIFVMFAYPFIYILEKIFGYISNVTLVELSDINSKALRELSETCPGTFQHSLQVSMLAAAAATKIRANPQLVRTGALYHDIGKISNPQYFVENRMSGPNPHDYITLEESAHIITNHVPEGIKIAVRHNFPPAIVQFIRTHHGKGKAKYFYNTFKNKFPDKPINEAVFTYDGENPDTRETALIMMADSIEAASRSLEDYSEESLKNLIDKIIDGQIADGLLANAPLTFKNILEIKQVFLEKLLSIYHFRIKYPEEKK
ncbi:MAG: HDIG domain-containing protein [Dysgonamonadaceae bacterium]|nr:HDIG domain-containing protein [Dysgonamonadaceae bacterium]